MTTNIEFDYRYADRLAILMDGPGEPAPWMRELAQAEARRAVADLARAEAKGGLQELLRFRDSL